MGSVETPHYRDQGRSGAEMLAEMADPSRRAKIVVLAAGVVASGGWAVGSVAGDGRADGSGSGTDGV
jgi:hypothetical protein